MKKKTFIYLFMLIIIVGCVFKLQTKKLMARADELREKVCYCLKLLIK